MHTGTLQNWQHSHLFALNNEQRGERRTRLVLVLTLLAIIWPFCLFTNLRQRMRPRSLAERGRREKSMQAWNDSPCYV